MNTYSAREWLRSLFGREEPAYDPLRAVARPPADGPLSFAEGNNRFALGDHVEETGLQPCPSLCLCSCWSAATRQRQTRDIRQAQAYRCEYQGGK